MALKKYALAAAVLATISSSTFAADADRGTITFHGLVTPNTCNITLKDDPLSSQTTKDFNVTLPTVSVEDFTPGTAADVNSTLGQAKFALSVSCADTELQSADAQFDSWGGSSANNEGALVPPTGLQGSATNVSLVLHNDGNTKTDLIKIDHPNNTQSTTLTDGKGELNYTVAYMGPATGVTSGSVQAQVAFTMNYQ